jgi:hypothetical protein
LQPFRWLCSLLTLNRIDACSHHANPRSPLGRASSADLYVPVPDDALI